MHISNWFHTCDAICHFGKNASNSNLYFKFVVRNSDDDVLPCVHGS